jgi:hypothetical protein
MEASVGVHAASEDVRAASVELKAPLVDVEQHDAASRLQAVQREDAALQELEQMKRVQAQRAGAGGLLGELETAEEQHDAASVDVNQPKAPIDEAVCILRSIMNPDVTVEQLEVSNSAIATEADEVLVVLQAAGVSVEAVYALGSIMSKSDATVESVAVVEALEAKLIEEGKPKEAKKVCRVAIKARVVMRTKLQCKMEVLSAAADEDLGAAAEAGHDLEAKLQASGDVQVAVQVGEVVECMDSMLEGEVSCEDLEVAVGKASSVAVKLRVEGKVGEAEVMEEVAVKLKKARVVKAKARVIQKKVRLKQEEMDALLDTWTTAEGKLLHTPATKLQALWRGLTARRALKRMKSPNELLALRALFKKFDVDGSGATDLLLSELTLSVWSRIPGCKRAR